MSLNIDRNWLGMVRHQELIIAPPPSCQALGMCSSSTWRRQLCCSCLTQVKHDELREAAASLLQELQAGKEWLADNKEDQVRFGHSPCIVGCHA